MNLLLRWYALSLCLGGEAIQHLIDDNNDDFDYNLDRDDSIYGDAKRHCECGYKEGHYDYCIF